MLIVPSFTEEALVEQRQASCAVGRRDAMHCSESIQEQVLAAVLVDGTSRCVELGHVLDHLARGCQRHRAALKEKTKSVAWLVFVALPAVASLRGECCGYSKVLEPKCYWGRFN